MSSKRRSAAHRATRSRRSTAATRSRPSTAARSPVPIRAGVPVVKVSTDADLLRLVPQLVGVETPDSVVFALFRGKRTNGAMRVDLPHDADEVQLRAWAARVLGMVCRVEGVDEIVVVAYTDATFAPSGRLPEAEVLRAVNRQAERMGIAVRNLLCVAADGWGSLLDPDLPRGGAPLAEIGVRPGDPVRPARVMPRPEPASGKAREVFADAFDRWWEHPEGPGGVLHGVDLRRPGSALGPALRLPPAMERYRHGGDQADVVELVERALDPHDDDPDAPCPCRALLFAIGMRQGLENLMLVQLGWGRDLGARLWAAAHAGDHTAPELDQMVAAIGGGAIRRPDVDRLERAIEVVAEIATYLPAGSQATTDGMLAWLHWALGSGSVAGDLAQRALRVDSDRDIPRLILARTTAGDLPEWAFREDPTTPDPLALPA